MKKTNKKIKKVSVWEKYLAQEIGIEFKACLYFFAILFFYSMYRICNGNWEASIVIMAEMIFTTYAMGYLQVYVLENFDEADALGGKELFGIVLCTTLYTIVSYAGKWFDRNIYLTAGFLGYIAFTYVCAFWIYKIKRDIDTRLLNEDLQAFKEREEWE